MPSGQQEIITSVLISIFACLRGDAPSWQACAASNSKSLFVENNLEYYVWIRGYLYAGLI